MYRRRPVTEIVNKIRELIKKNEYGSLSLSNKIVSTGINKSMNHGRIERAFYQGVNKLSYVKSLDDTIESVLTLFGLTCEDLYTMLLEDSTKGFDKEQREFLEFIGNPDAKPFIKIAMAKYKIKKLEDEVNGIK